MQAPLLVWFRQDLRLCDNPALSEAASRGPIIPIFILDDQAAGQWATGGASRWGLHHALESLAADLEKKGVKLILKKGDSAAVIDRLIAETGARGVYWNRRYESYGIVQDKKIKESLTKRGLDVQSFNGKLLTEPWEISPQAARSAVGQAYKVFTPYWKACLARFANHPVSFPLPAPDTIKSPKELPDSDALHDWKLLPTTPDWSEGMKKEWLPFTESAARKRLGDFIDDCIAEYSDRRDFPADPKTSKLSPFLAFGQISPRQIWHAVHTAQISGTIPDAPAEHYLREIGWREFSWHLLYHFPFLTDKPLNPKFEQFPWRENEKELRLWQRGQTGVPLVDAGMRELWRTGWMHNRVRMIAASYLVKNLLLDWRMGMAWFWDTLLDADLANNTCSWQWVAGCGADAAPYFRIFNPALQAEKFDPENDYIRQYVPEFESPSYPKPVIAHDVARKRALAALKDTTHDRTP